MTPNAMHRLPLQNESLQAWIATGCGPEKQPIKGIVAILPAAEMAQLPLLQQVCREAGIGLLGAVFPRLIDADQLVDEGAWLLPYPHAPAGFLLGGLARDVQAGGDAIAEAAMDAMAQLKLRAQPSRSTLLLVFDGQLPRIGSLVEQAYLQLDGRLRLVGVNAGRGDFQPAPCLFDDQRVIAGGALGLLVPEAMRSALAMHPGKPGPLHTVTESRDNRVSSIDGRPAFEVYRELVQRDHGIALCADNFYDYAVHYPLVITRGDDQVLYRIPVKLEADGGITCIGEIPQHGLLGVLKAQEPAQVHCAAALAQALQPQLPGGQLVLFYCAGRNQHFGDSIHDELQQLQQLLQPAVQSGALVLGEIGNTHSWGYPLFYNGAIVGLGWDKT